MPSEQTFRIDARCCALMLKDVLSTQALDADASRAGLSAAAQGFEFCCRPPSAHAETWFIVAAPPEVGGVLLSPGRLGSFIKVEKSWYLPRKACGRFAPCLSGCRDKAEGPATLHNGADPPLGKGGT